MKVLEAGASEVSAKPRLLCKMCQEMTGVPGPHSKTTGSRNLEESVSGECRRRPRSCGPSGPSVTRGSSPALRSSRPVQRGDDGLLT